MKRFSKILVAVLALCLLVGALALAISANTGVEGKFVVQGTGYETWEDAVAAANNTHTIYINENWELEKGITLSGETTNVKVNLNGKTVSVKDGSMLFNVHTNAKLTIEGEGTLNNNGLVLIGGSNYGEVTVNATGAGIVIENNATAGDVNTFRFQSNATLNVFGKIVVNTNAVTENRAIFNIADNSDKPVTLNIKDADILYANPTVTGAPIGKVIFTWNSTVNIDDSKLEGVYSYLIWCNTSTQITIGGYMKDESTESTMNPIWDPDKIDEAKKKLSINVNETITANNSVFSSILSETYKSAVRGNLMFLNGGATKGDFTNCEFYGYSRAILGKQGDTAWRDHFGSAVDDSKVATKSTDASQLTFVDCHFRHNNAHTEGSYLFCYGPNVRFLGGSTNGFTLANCQPHYLELTDENGELTGQWLGVYVDNVLGVTGLKGNDQVISTAWQNTAAYNPHAIFKGTLPHPVTVVVGGKSMTFTTGYITDENFISVIHKLDGNNVTAGAFHSKNNNPFAPIVVPPSNVSSSECVLDANGNGYLKYSYTGEAANVNNWWYPKIGSFTDSDYIVFEFDIAADELEELPVSEGNFQFRETTPYFGVDGSYIGDSSLLYTNFSNMGFNGDRVRFNYTYYNISTEPGFWNRLTVVFELNKGPVEKIKIQAFNADKTPATDESGNPIYVEKNAYSIDDSKAHFYVNGVLMSSVDFAPSTWGYHVSTVKNPYNANAVIHEGATKDGAYIIEGYESKYYLGSDIRMGASASKPSAVCLDNFYLAKYIDKDDNLLGLYDENGALKNTITPNDYVLVMPDNNGLYVPAPVVAEVDGVGYSSEEAAIAAIKEGSTVELFKNFESLIEANVAFKLITNGYTVPGFVSSTHKLLDYTDGMGFYKLVLADDSELYTVNYTFNGVTKTQTVAKGTVIPAMEEYFPAILNGEKLLVVDSWTVPENVNDYALAGNVITAVAVPVEKDAAAVAGNVAYETFEDAILDAHGDPIKLLKDITVEALDGVVASTYIAANAASKTNVPVGINVASGANITIDFNGKTVTQNFEGVLFNVTNGTLTLTGAATFNNVGTFARATGENSKVVVEATGDGFCVNEFATADGIYNVFVAEGKADLAVSGKIAINNAYYTILFKVSGSDTIEFNNANVVNDGPSAERGLLPSKFLYMGDGVTVNIESSKLQVNCGDMFVVGGAGKAFSIKDYLPDSRTEDKTTYKHLYAKDECLENGVLKGVYFPEFTSFINANNSELIAHLGAPDKASQSAVGGLFRVGDSAVKIVLNDCDLQGNNRSIQGGSRPYTSQSVSPNQFIFTNVNYTEIATKDNSGNYSRNTFQENTNVIWIGGTATTSIGCQFAPMFAENGAIGMHYFNTNYGDSYDITTWQKETSSAWTRFYASYKSAAAIVDGIVCKTEGDVAAAIKDGSKVMLLKAANITADKAFDVYTSNGYIPAGIVSATHKAVVDAKGNIKVSAASAGEIFTINYAFGGKTATQTAALGTVIVAPKEIDDRFVDSDSKKIVVLNGWTLVEGEDVVVVTGNANAIAKTESADPVIVYWTTADGETVLDTDYYLPGEHTTLPEFDGEDIAVDYTQNAYYGVARTGWAGIENVNLAASGEYPITAVMGKVAPYNFPGLKYNLSLYANYVINFYVPTEIDGVSNVVVSTAADGSASISKFEPGTIEGVPHDKFGYMLGIADTEIKTFYLVYNVGEDKISFPVYVGVPTYAAIVMDQFDEDTSAKGEATKSLIVNMANYATKVLALDENKFDMTAPGAKIYSGIVEEYGDEYLTLYKGLTNERFLEGEAGDLYETHGVAALNWVTGTDENAANKEALTYIESIGFSFNTFEPAFLIKYSDKAIERGLQKPASVGQTDYFTAGVHVYAGCYSPYVTTHWAEKDGVKYYNNKDVWAYVGENDEIKSNGDTSYDYYVLVSNNVWKPRTDDRNEWYKVEHIRYKLDIQVYWSYVVEQTVEKEVDGVKTQVVEKVKKTDTIGHVYYSLAAYINDMLEDAEANAEYIDAAKALYAYSHASATYGSTK